MIIVREQIFGIRKKIMILFFVGVALSLFLKSSLGLSSHMFFVDMFFVISMMFLFCALFEIVSNSGFFNGLVFGSKCVYRIFKSQLGTSAEVGDEYIEYINSRHKSGDVSALLFVGIIFFAVSVLFSLI